MPPINRTLLFWLDGLGGLASASMLGVVLPELQAWVGLPVRALHLLALVALCCAAFSLLHAAGILRHSPVRLRIIAAINGSYCLGTLALIAVHRERLEIWGAVYFAAEIAIILTLATLEIRAANQPGSGRCLR